MKIREFRDSDSVEVSRMLRAAFKWFHKGDRSSWLWKSFEPCKLIANSKQLEVLVAVNDFGKIVGYLSSSNTPYGVAYIQAVAVHPKLQSKGIGKKLLNEKLKRLRKQKTRKVWLLVTNTNPGALKFYLKMNFFVEGYLRDHTGPGSDEILLSRFL